MNRRKFLKVSTSGALVGIVGCTTPQSDETITEEPRIDNPPQEIHPQSWSDYQDMDYQEAIDNWNNDYLGENINIDSSLEFKRLNMSRFSINTPILSESMNTNYNHYFVNFINSQDKARSTFEYENMSDDIVNEIEETDFSESIFYVVKSGYGSGSIGHRWSGVTTVDDSLTAIGYYTKPFEQTDDITTRSSIVKVSNVDNPDYIRVSLTVDENNRVHFNSTEGVVSVEL